MSTPVYLSEQAERGPFSGTGPHTVATSIPATTAERYAFGALVIIKDESTKDVYYVCMVRLVKTTNTTVAISAPIEWPGAAVGWSGNVSIAASIVSSELVLDVTIPAGHTVEISFRIEGVYT